MAVGCARGAYEHALPWAGEREQFGRPIAGFQLVQDLLSGRWPTPTRAPARVNA